MSADATLVKRSDVHLSFGAVSFTKEGQNPIRLDIVLTETEARELSHVLNRALTRD